MTKRKAEERESTLLSLEQKTDICTGAAMSRKAYDLTVLDLSGHSFITDYFFICSGNSTRQVQSIADAMDDQLSKRGVQPLGKEGYAEARWILLDYGELVVHIFHHETRKIYDLERLWGNAPVVYSHEGEPAVD